MTDKTVCPLIEKIGIHSSETGVSFTGGKHGLDKVRVTDQEIVNICLNCPLSICVFSEPNYIQKEARRTRINQAKEMRRAGLSAEQIGVVMGLKKKTIYRYLAYLD